LPAARLQPLPFPEPSHLIDLVEQDPSLLEPGLRVVVRRVPLPDKIGAGSLDALAVDASGRCVGLRVAERATPHVLEEAIAARAWLSEAMPTLRAVCPQIGSSPHVRFLILASDRDEMSAAIQAFLAAAGVEVARVQAFDSPSGLALCVRTPGARAPQPEAPAATAIPKAPSAVTAGRRSDPLSGIPLSAEEAAEFGRLNSMTPPHRPPAPAERRLSTAFHPAVVSGGASMEN